MPKALMLEGPRRGKVFEVKGSRLNVAVAQTNAGIEMPWYLAFQSFDAYKINFFGVVIHVWVPSHILTGRERNVWALNRMIAPELHSGMIDVADVPAEWFNPGSPVHVTAERQGELGV